METTRTLKLVPFVEQYHRTGGVTHTTASMPDNPVPHKVVILDVETTGLDKNSEEITEIALLTGQVDANTGALLSVEDLYWAFNDPGKPTPERVRQITGISDEDVQGQKPDMQRIAQAFAGNPVVIAHNASFDRPFVDRLLANHGISTELHWGCSIRDVDWLEELGTTSRGLEFLLFKSGYFYDAHRAWVDVLALAWLLQERPAAMKSILEASGHGEVLVQATGSPYEVKDELRHNGFRWNNSVRVWERKIAESSLDQLLAFLDELYPSASQRATITPIPATQRFA